jgi:serine protease Do
MLRMMQAVGRAFKIRDLTRSGQVTRQYQQNSILSTFIQRFAMLFVVATLASPAVAVAAAPTANTPVSFADLAEQVLPAVVNITVEKTVQSPQPLEEFFRRFGPREFGDESGQGQAPKRRRAGGGTGFIIDSSGILVTNNHVVDGAESITVTLHSGEEYKAEVIGTDAPTDIAVLKITPKKPLPAVKFGDSDKVRVGDWVITIGNPFGLSGSVTAGIISARNRDINTGLYDDFLQTDSPINPGNSGGPMFNMDGEVIGMNTAIFSPSGANNGIGFAIPSNMTKSIVAQLRASGKVKRGWLGVSFQVVTKEMAESLGLKSANGALVASVTAGGPADKGGIKDGDVIIQFDGKDITDTQRLPSIVANTPIGKTVKVVVVRKGKPLTLSVTVAERKEDQLAQADGKPMPGSGDEKTVLSMTVGALTPEVRESLGLGDDIKGVVVLYVEGGSDADAKGLQRGDVIVSVSLEDVDSPAAFAKRVEDVRKSGRPSVLLRIYRGGNYSHITVPFAK